MELSVLVAQERVAPPEKVSMDYYGSVKGIRPGIHTNLKFSDAVEKGVGAWDQ